MIHVEFVQGFYDSFWGCIQAISAIVMGVFTWQLLKVTRMQQEMLVEMERGRLKGTVVGIGAANLDVSFRNDGKNHVEIYDVRYRGYEGDTPDHPWREHYAWLEGTIHVAPGTHEKVNTIAYTAQCLNPDGSKKREFNVLFRVKYRTLGQERVYWFAWCFNTNDVGLRTHSRCMQRGLERDDKPGNFD